MTLPSMESKADSVPYEQAVYGSFPFWDQGYGLLAQSPGCRSEWLTDFRHACQRLGERPSTVDEAPALFTIKLSSGPWLIVGVFPQGRDDAGRPGALAFHALFLKGSDYRRAGASPFAFAPLLRDDWTAEDRRLDAGRFSPSRLQMKEPSSDTTVSAIARAIEHGRRVIVETPSPIDDLARDVWEALRPKTRAKATVATWAFSSANDYDLIGMPRLHLPIEPPYVDLATLLAETPAEVAFHTESRARRVVRWLVWGFFAALGVLVLWLTWLSSDS